MSSEYIKNLLEPQELTKNKLSIELQQNLDSSNKTNLENPQQVSSSKTFIFSKKLIASFIINFLLFSLIFILVHYHKKVKPLKKLISFETDEKKNLIRLKFNVKNPKIPVKLFNSTSQIQAHIKSLQIGGKEENITNEFTFGFSGKYKVKIYLKDKLTSIKNLFSGCSQLMIADFSDFISDEVTDMSGLFQGCHRLKYVELEDFKTQKVTNMENMFNGCKHLNDLNLTHFDTSNVQYMD